MNSYDERIKKLEKDIYQTQELGLSLSQDIHFEQNKICDLKHCLNTIEKELETVKEDKKENDNKYIKELKDEVHKQCLEIIKISDQNISSKYELQIKQTMADLTQQIKNIDELKLNLSDFDEHKKEVGKAILKNNLAIDGLQQKYNHSTKDITDNMKGLKDIKTWEEDQQQLLLKVSEQQQSLDKFSKSTEEKFKYFEKMQREQIGSFKMGESESNKKSSGHLELQTVEDRIQKETCMGFGKTNLSALILEIYAAFRGYTLVVKSEGCVSEHQSDVLGVYRMVDSYNDRPVYKQDGGENYIYYSSASSSWLVGTVVGHSYGWLRNSSSARWVPDITSGWEYRPLIRSWDSTDQGSWLSDDGTLRIEPLQAVDSILPQIKDVKNKDVD